MNSVTSNQANGGKTEQVSNRLDTTGGYLAFNATEANYMSESINELTG